VNAFPRRRRNVFALFLFVWGLVVVGRLAQLQLAQGAKYRAKAQRQQERKIELSPRRGSILDREGRDLAVSVEVSSVYAAPDDVTNAAVEARALAPIIGMPERALLTKLQSEKGFVWLVRKIDVAVADRLDSVAGHGTFIAGVVMQHAPAAHLLISRIVEEDGVTDERRLLNGLAHLRSSAHAAAIPIDVVSLSLGCYTHDDRPSPALHHGINAFANDTVIVACAGNANSERPYWPAALKNVTAVASLDATGTDRASFSNYGWWVDACTSGDHVVSSFFSSAGLGPDGDETFNGYATWSGTSFAAPRVAAVIAASAAQHGVSATVAAADLLDPSRHRSMPDLGVFVDAPAGGAST